MASKRCGKESDCSLLFKLWWDNENTKWSPPRKMGGLKFALKGGHKFLLVSVGGTLREGAFYIWASAGGGFTYMLQCCSLFYDSVI